MKQLFFGAGTLIGALILGITVMLSNAPITASQDVSEGFELWQTYGCESCHTLYGQGGNYAPDLTHIHTLRGDDYIRDFIVAPTSYHPDARIMPRFTINQSEIEDLLAMFAWTASTDAIDWPPNAIQISGSAGLNINTNAQMTTIDPDADPLLAQGQLIYSQRCAPCHATVAGVTLTGPSFWNIANTAGERVAGDDAETYLRNSILYPSDYVVAGFADVMQKNFAEVLSSNDIAAIIAYLMTLDGEVSQ
ncbi:MAG: hypothetical protein Phog2KO_32110 [Phototrophicaceae bacterium]